MPSKMWRYTILTIALVAFVLSVYSLVKSEDIKPLLLGTKRFDHFTYHNLSTNHVMSVKFELRDATGAPWGPCPPGGWDMGPAAPGQTLTWVMNLTAGSAGVAVAECKIEYDDGGPQADSLVVNAPQYQEFNAAEFWFGPRMDGGPPGPLDMAGQGVTNAGLTVNHP